MAWFDDFTGFLGDNAGQLIGAGLGALVGAQGSQDQRATQAPFMFQGQGEGITNFLDASKQQYLAGPQQFYPGQQVASLDPNVIGGQNAALGTIPAQQQMADLTAFGAGDLLSGGAGRIDGFNLPNQVGFGIDQGLENAVMNPIMSSLRNDVLPALDLSATSQGAFGGTRHAMQRGRAASSAVESAAEAVARANLEARGQSIQQRGGDINAMISGRGQDINQNQLYNNAVRSGIDATTRAQDALLVPSNIQSQVGAARTAYGQSLLDADRARWDFNQQASIDAIDRLGQRMAMTPQGSVRTIHGQNGDWVSMLGGALSGVSLANSFRNTGAPLPQDQTSRPVVFGQDTDQQMRDWGIFG